MNRKGVSKKAKKDGVTFEQTEIRIAPIPSPEDLQKYEQINPGFAERIITMAEQERFDRNKREDRKVEVFENVDKRRFKLKSRSLFVSLFVIFGFLGVAVFCLTLGYKYIALGIIGVHLVGIVGYLTSAKKGRNDTD